MKFAKLIKALGRCAVIAVAFFLIVPSLLAYEMRIDEVEGMADATVEVDVLLDSATNVACVEFQLNYDAQLVEFLSLTNPVGSLGDAFDLDYVDNDGSSVVSLHREGGLISGTGVLVTIEFHIRDGAEPGMFSDLTIASKSLCGEFGGNLALKGSVTHINGKLWTVLSSTNDSDNDGISDYIEQTYDGSADYNPGVTDTDTSDPDTDDDLMPDGWEINNLLDPLADNATADADGDGLTDLQEYNAGGNPQVTDTDNDNQDDYIEWIAGTSLTNDTEKFEVETLLGSGTNDVVMSWMARTGRVYRVVTSTDICDSLSWTNVPESVYTNIQGSGAMINYTNRQPDGLRYFRLKTRRE